ncbi:ATP-dependent helicase HrpB [Coraliomargarita sp. SDUM461004]|uniref:ATP-dependent helicase HrpB n=1 Tax=Thalassobacterium sedimentorum TaxID=3041258 RepID=A0ABU1AFT6_9BACT|nr:ATP-dependent helicase HrpB [Coraliomargarita sp. SDUM461004]MDQ8193537.1 ATP-dependent helicase HrpB [Coraliomargarita sp. SDUM461004]
MPPIPPTLPIYDVADDLLTGLAETGRVVLSAPTGSGKSTQIPQILLDRSKIEGEIVVLQPRRLAARLLAKRVAVERGVPLGGEVGYQIRFENVVSAQTRIRFVTEAILLRQLLDDPMLKGVGAVVFDEFHERHLTSDLSLACALQVLGEARADLKLVVMSATLDIDILEDFLAPCHRVEAAGRMYPVEIRYAGAALGRQAGPVWERAAGAFKKSVASKVSGDVLIFMPGAFEIRKTIECIENLPESHGYEVLPLHGELSPDAQDRAVSSGGRPKIIVSTNVAETSITIEGVRVVIDGGLARIARYDARRGINSILVEPISRAAAEQRTGRAGRTGPGVCVRLWSEAEHLARSERDEAEVKRVDLSETVLMLAAAGIQDLKCFPWFEAPDSDVLERAYLLLRDLGALNSDNLITDLGDKMAGFPLHPRYARLLIEADRLGVLPDVALIAALSQGRHFYRTARDAHIRREQLRQVEDHADSRSDFFVHLRAWEVAHAAKFNPNTCGALGIHAGAARQASAVAQQILKLAGKAGLDVRSGVLPDFEERICKCLLVAFSDHLAIRNDRGTRRCRMVHGRSGELRRESVVESELFVAAEIEERELRGEVTVLLGLATVVEPRWLDELFDADFSEAQLTRYDESARRVVCRQERRFRDLVLKSNDRGEPNCDEAAALLAAEVVAGKLNLKKWDSVVENWIQRVNFVARHCPETEVASIDDEARQLLIEQICHGAFSYKDIKDRPVLDTVKEWIRPEQLYYIDSYAPAEMSLPRRNRPARIRYEADGRAIIASKLQDFYDVPSSQLRVANGRVSLLVELLAPNQRPAHLTDDLDGFWSGAYQHVRKELAGRYPKHEWR